MVNHKATVINIMQFSFLFVLFKYGVSLLSSENRNTGYQRDSCWPSSAVQAVAAAVPARVPIDWTALRENRDKFEAIKWQGDSIKADLDITGRVLDITRLNSNLYVIL